MNWNRPGLIWIGWPRTVQSSMMDEKFVLARTVKVAPGALLLKINWNLVVAPAPSESEPLDAVFERTLSVSGILREKVGARADGSAPRSRY